MKPHKTEDIFTCLVDIFKHIQEVQQDVLELSERSVICFHSLLAEHKIEPDEKTLEVFQYQDIISQQLNAVGEAIDAIQKGILLYSHSVKQDEDMLGEDTEKLFEWLSKSIKTAKEKKESFSGNALEIKQVDSVMFFD